MVNEAEAEKEKVKAIEAQKTADEGKNEAMNIYNLQQEVIMDTIVKIVRSKECILFLGAGVHAPPPTSSDYNYSDSERPPNGTVIAEQLAEGTKFSKELPYVSTKNIRRVSQYYEFIHSRRALIDKLRDAFSGSGEQIKRPSPVLKALGELSFPFIITTNYDQLIEMALNNAGKTPIKKVFDKTKDNPASDYPCGPNPTPEQPFLFKMHGDIDIPESIVITDEDYIDFTLKMGSSGSYDSALDTVRFYLKRWPTIFIGYSLMDYNLRLLFKTLRFKVDPSNFPPSYSVGPSPDILIVEFYGKYISFLIKDVWEFVPELYHKLKGKEMPT